MEAARSQRAMQYPNSWKQFAYGYWAKGHIQTRLNEWLPKLFGYHMLKLGGLSCELDTKLSNIPHQVAVDKSNTGRNIEAENNALPFIAKAFDVCIIANQLDYTDDPHRLLREIDRVLIDDGYLIITGVNPCSLMGIGRVFPWRKNTLPWNGRMFSPPRVRDWLGLLNYQIIESTCFGLVPNTKNRWYFAWLESQFATVLPLVGSLYFIVACKRTYPLNPIQPQWQRKKRLIPAQGLGCAMYHCDWL